MQQKKLVLIFPIPAEPVHAPPVRAKFQLVLLINRIRASWTMNKSPRGLPSYVSPIQQAIAKSRVRRKRTSDNRLGLQQNGFRQP